jgi:hypothetical protein
VRSSEIIVPNAAPQKKFPGNGTPEAATAFGGGARGPRGRAAIAGDEVGK